MTKSPKTDGLHGTVSLGYGSHHTWKQSYDLSGRKDKLSYGVSYERKDTDGWRSFLSAEKKTKKSKGKMVDNFKGIDTSYLDTNADGTKYIVGDRGNKKVHSGSIGLRLGYDLDDSQRLTYKYVHSDYDWSYSDPATYMKDGKWKATGATAFGNRGYRVYDMHSLTYNDQKDKIHAHFGMTDYTKDGSLTPGSKINPQTLEGKGNKTAYPSKSWSFDINKRWNVENHTLLVGATYGKDTMDCTYEDQLTDWRQWNSPVISSDKDRMGGGKATAKALYIQDKWQVTDQTALYLGGRYDSYQKHDGYSTFKGKTASIKSETYTQFSPKISIAYEQDKATHIYISYGKSFAPPLMYQLFRYSNRFGNTYIPNPALKPETTTTYELGYKKEMGSTKMNANIFLAKTHDYIELSEVKGEAKSGKTKTYDNIGTADTKGVELSVTHDINTNWSAYGNYTYQVGNIDESGSGLSQTNYDIPKHLFHVGIGYRKEAWSVYVDGSYVSSRNKPGEVSGKFESKDARFLVNMNANYQMNDQLSWQLSMQNLFNKKYFDQEAGSDKYYVGDGRTVTLSARYRF